MLVCGDTIPHTVDTVINKTEEVPVLKELIFQREREKLSIKNINK